MRLQRGKYYLMINPLGNEKTVVCYVGRQEKFECCVCGKGHNVYTFNAPYIMDNLEAFHEDITLDEILELEKNPTFDYETWGFGKTHMPIIIKEII